jgi:peptide/nickel transport system substrate-binding protein
MESEQRELSRRAMLAGLAAAPAAAFLPQPAAAAPKQGGFARFGTSDGSATDSMDPATWPGSFTENALGGAMCNNLTQLLPDGSVAPDLAASYEPMGGANKWLFRITKGASFHNGKSVTPGDVIASIRHHMGPDSKSAAKSIVTQISDIQPDGSDGVAFTLVGGNADFPYLMADYHLPIMPADSSGKMDLAAKVGSGPFKLERFEPGIAAKFTRNKDYFHNGKPYFDEVEFLAIHDVTARTNALLTGEIHWMNDVDIKTMGLLKRNPAVAIQNVQSTRHFNFDMNTTVPPFDNPKVRLAVKYAIDREEIVAKVFLGNAKPGNDDTVAPVVKFYADPQPSHTYDPEKAKALLKDAGVTELKVDLSVADVAFPGAVDAAQLFREQAAKAGITVNIIRESNDGYWSKIWLVKPFVAVDWYGRGSCDWLFSTTLAKGAAWNDTKWDNPRFNELLVQARNLTDDSKRAPLYAEMQQLLHDDGGMIQIVYARYLNAISNKLATGPIGGIFPGDNSRMAERWWMA